MHSSRRLRHTGHMSGMIPFVKGWMTYANDGINQRIVGNPMYAIGRKSQDDNSEENLNSMEDERPARKGQHIGRASAFSVHLVMSFLRESLINLKTKEDENLKGSVG